jgi:hypothetical protein
VVLLTVQVFWDVMLCQLGDPDILKDQNALLGLLHPEDEGTIIIQLVRN